MRGGRPEHDNRAALPLGPSSSMSASTTLESNDPLLLHVDGGGAGRRRTAYTIFDAQTLNAIVEHPQRPRPHSGRYPHIGPVKLDAMAMTSTCVSSFT